MLLIIFNFTFGIIFSVEAQVIANPSFEQNIDGWLLSSSDAVSFDPSIGKSETGSLKIVDNGNNPFAYQYGINVQPNTMYEFRAWVKGLNGQDSDAALKLEWYNQQNVNTSGKYQHLQTKGSGEWQQIRIVGISDQDSTKVSIYLRLYGAGTLWFDDVSFKVFTSGFVMDKNLMGIESYQPDGFPIELRIFSLTGQEKYRYLYVKLTKNYTTQEFLLDTPIINIADSPNEKLYTWYVPLSILESGIYDLTIKMPEIDENYYEQIVLNVAVPNRKPANLTADGVFIVSGKLFFPIGLYHVSPEKYQLIAEHGFNAVQGTPTYDTTVVSQNLTLAQQAGVMVDQGLYYRGTIKERLENYKNVIRQNKNHSNILNWKIIDEPNKRGTKMQTEVAEAYAEYKLLDPLTPMSLTVGPEIDVYEFWGKSCDAFQVDPYPIPNLPLTMVSDHVSAAKQVLEPWQNLTAVLQAGWIPGPSVDQPLNQPTKAQARSMVYLALINGAKGIFWYSMEDPGWDLTLTPLWNEFRSLNEETAWLGNIVIRGERISSIENKTGDIQYAGWKYKDYIYIFATNAGNSAHGINIFLGDNIFLVNQKFDKTDPIINQKSLIDSLPPLFSTVYVFKTNINLADSTIVLVEPKVFNPASSSCRIISTCDSGSRYQIEILNLSGKLVRSFEGICESNNLIEVLWDGKNSSNILVANGLYFVKIKIYSASGKMTMERIEKLIMAR